MFYPSFFFLNKKYTTLDISEDISQSIKKYPILFISIYILSILYLYINSQFYWILLLLLLLLFIIMQMMIMILFLFVYYAMYSYKNKQWQQKNIVTVVSLLWKCYIDKCIFLLGQSVWKSQTMGLNCWNPQTLVLILNSFHILRKCA